MAMGRTAIEWAHYTHNFWWGCEKVSDACKHCYAETFANRIGRSGLWGPGSARRFPSEQYLRQPFGWDRLAAADGVRRRVFSNSMSDIFEDRPELVAERREAWRVIQQTPQLDWLLLTKRPENFARMLPWTEEGCGDVCKAGNIDGVCCPDDECDLEPGGVRSWPWPNVWLGVTAENQEELDRRGWILERTPAAVRFLSCEPLLDRLALPMTKVTQGGCSIAPHETRYVCPFDWVIVGGESGPKARPMSSAWVRSLRDQCVRSRTAFFFKQWGTWVPSDDLTESYLRLGKKEAGRHLDGRTWDEVPQ
jgi:protein gp37